MILWWANLDGPKAVPGAYKVSMSVGDQTIATHDFSILPDPRAEASVADMQAQYDFITKVNTTIKDAHDAIKNIRDVNAKLSVFMKKYKGDAAVSDLYTMAKDMKASLETVEKALYQTQNRSGQDPLNFPIRLTNKLGHLNSLVGLDDFPPTEQDIAVKNELTQKINEQLDTFNKLVTEEITAFNAAFNSKNLNYLFV